MPSGLAGGAAEHDVGIPVPVHVVEGQRSSGEDGGAGIRGDPVRRVVGECLGEEEWDEWPAEKRAKRIAIAIRNREAPPDMLGTKARKTLAVFQAFAVTRALLPTGRLNCHSWCRRECRLDFLPPDSVSLSLESSTHTVSVPSQSLP